MPLSGKEWYLWILSLSAKNTMGSYKSITSQWCLSDPIACTLKLRWQLLLSKVITFKKVQGENNQNKKKAGERIKENYSYHSSRLSPVFHTFSHHKQQIITFMAFFQKHSLTCKRNWKHSINIAKGINKRNWGIPMVYWRHLIWFNSWTLLLET